MQQVAIISIGWSAVREHWDLSIRELADQAIQQALAPFPEIKPQGLFVGNMLSGALSEQEHLAGLIADYSGLSGIEALKVEAACASGGAAFHQAVRAVGAGYMEAALVVGVEKLTEFSGKFSAKALATAADADYEASLGLSFAALNALIMQRYMHEYGIDKDDFSIFPIIAHENGQYNPHALYSYSISKEQYRKAKAIATPINLLDSSPICDGAAAILLINLNQARKMVPEPIVISACELASDTLALANRKSILHLSAVEKTTQRALKTAGLDHKQIQLLEIHDAFSIITALSLEQSGFVSPGKAVPLAWQGTFSLQGTWPISTLGGLKARGHPVGATGVYQIVDAARQLWRKAPEKLQLDNPSVALTQNIGGIGGTVVTSILQKI